MSWTATCAMMACVLSIGLRPSTAAEPERSAATETTYSYLERRLGAMIDEMDWGGGRIAVRVEDLDLPIPVFSLHENQAFYPAQAMQVLTAAVALESLGPGYRFTTELCIVGSIEKKQLQGALIVRGNGDPSISGRFDKKPDTALELFDRWAKALRKRGIKKVQGSLIADARAFDDVFESPGWPPRLRGSVDIPTVAALNFNHNAIDIFWRGGKKPGELAKYRMFPDLDDFVRFANQVRTAENPRRPRTYERMERGNLISAVGDLPLKGRAHDRAAIGDPPTFFDKTLKKQLLEKGVEVQGPAVSAFDLSPVEIPEPTETIVTHRSPPLVKLLERIMRHDLALDAEVIFKTLGRKATGQPGSFRGGFRAIERFLDGVQLGGGVWSVMDGSGRSPGDRLTAAHIVRVMKWMHERPRHRVFEDLFPQAWTEGILSERFLPASGKKDGGLFSPRLPRIWAKTGSAEGVETIVGWAEPYPDRRLVFAILVNDSKTPPDLLRRQIDTLALEIAGVRTHQ